jgi:hypothetical protein
MICCQKVTYMNRERIHVKIGADQRDTEREREGGREGGRL